ncbi:MAG: alpha/beta hydrolase-fold protein [Hellea sp.]
MRILAGGILTLYLGLTACSDISPTPAIDDAASSIAQPIEYGTRLSFVSKITNETHEINIWTPPDMGKDGKTYPILYVIDGGMDQDFQHIAGLAQLASISNRFETPIVVGIRTSNRYYQLTPKMTDSRYLPWNGTEGKPEMGGADDFHRFIQEELRPHIEKTYPNNDRRIILGESLAGYYITREFLRYPESFTDYIAVSPSLWLDDQRLAKEASALLEKHDDTSRRIYFTMADEGGTMQAGLDKVMTAITARDFKDLNMIYVDRRNSESHSTIYHGAALDALTQLFGIPPVDYGPAPWYLREGGQPEEDEP